MAHEDVAREDVPSAPLFEGVSQGSLRRSHASVSEKAFVHACPGCVPTVHAQASTSRGFLPVVRHTKVHGRAVHGHLRPLGMQAEEERLVQLVLCLTSALPVGHLPRPGFPAPCPSPFFLQRESGLLKMPWVPNRGVPRRLFPSGLGVGSRENSASKQKQEHRGVLGS